MATTYDYALVGLGLQNTLVVLALAALRPGARVAVVEREATPYGSHTWCFHAGDLCESAREIVQPAVAVEWPRYAVRFPGHERQLEQPYAAVTVSSLRAALRGALRKLEVDEFFGQPAVEVGEHLVRLGDGRELSATLVIDARGPSVSDLSVAGFQKFVGYELKLARPARFTPMVMDATVEQLDGFRFMYALPLAPDRVLVEDTYYSRSSELDTEALGRRVLAYAAVHGLEVAGIERSEQGVLPLPSKNAARESLTGPLRAGYRGGFFHPVTGYSFPLAMRLALHVAGREPAQVRGPELAQLVRELAEQARFLCFLNALLFRAMPDELRRNVLERFYRLPEGTIRRFYAMALTRTDRMRLVCGRPPRGFSVFQALSTRDPRFV